MMDKKINEHMHELLDFIENNISTGVDTKILSKIGYTSHAKLYRVFYNMTGHSVKEYIRKRRLSNALALVKASEMSLVDIAIHCGYSSQQAFCRAVKQTLGITPSEYMDSNKYYFFPPVKGETPQTVTVLNETIPGTIQVLFYHSRLKDIENKAVNALLQVYPHYDGRIFGRNGKQRERKFCYELQFLDTNNRYDLLKAHGFEGFQKFPAFTSTFATLVVQNNESQINAAWNYLYTEWLQDSMFEYTDEPYFEEFQLYKGRPTRLKLYLPIRKRSEITNISVISNPGLRFITATAKGYNAEKIASETVVDYLANYPYMTISTRKLYLHKKDNSYTCGVRVNFEPNIENNENIKRFVTSHAHYLMLEGHVMGDYDKYADMLFSFAQDNRWDVKKDELFAVYDAEKSFDKLSVKMYCPVKIDIK